MARTFEREQKDVDIQVIFLPPTRRVITAQLQALTK
jgi:hypothetical protein